VQSLGHDTFRQRFPRDGLRDGAGVTSVSARTPLARHNAWLEERMATKAKHYASEGARSLTPHLTVKGAKQAIEFYKRAFGAVVKGVSEDPSGLVLHSQLMIGDSLLFLNDEFPAMGAKGPLTLGGTPVTIHLFVPDADKTFDTAVAAGAKVAMPMGDQFWGDRYGMVIDPFGHSWSISTHLEDLTPDEIMERMKKAMATMGQH